ncbi:MAG TPA: metalloregulator ArsR/SmtB family transcription factor [Acidimicrobiales bacterium]|nr:metalloregulator ArsR/SmtB family transcription factor [Acidimicrobiales bacterium]
MPAPERRAGEGEDLFAALADPTRRRLLDRLSSDGPLSATDLARNAPVSRQAVAKHLGTLTAAGLVQPQRRGREVLYGVSPARLADASRWLADLGAKWDDRLAALGKQLAD